MAAEGAFLGQGSRIRQQSYLLNFLKELVFMLMVQSVGM